MIGFTTKPKQVEIIDEGIKVQIWEGKYLVFRDESLPAPAHEIAKHPEHFNVIGVGTKDGVEYGIIPIDEDIEEEW